MLRCTFSVRYSCMQIQRIKNMKQTTEHINTIIIGAGQAGLATGYYLKKHNIDFLIFDDAAAIGESWLKRWDSLRLFTPARYNGLPGFSFPGNKKMFPSKDDMAAYLKEYATQFKLPVVLGTKVTAIERMHDHFEIRLADRSLTCTHVVVATGANPVPKIPMFDNQPDPRIFQLHTSAFTNPFDIPPGTVLVIGAGASGVQISIELAKSHKVYLAGKPTFHIPDGVFKIAGRFYWWFINHVLTVNTPIGRKVRSKVLNGGGPLINVSVDDVSAAGVTMLPRLKGFIDGMPQFENNQVIACNTIIWATGFRPDFSWIKPDVTDGSGWPATYRGVSSLCPNLFFVGMAFQYSLASGIIGGVGRDAAYVAKEIEKRNRGPIGLI